MQHNFHSYRFIQFAILSLLFVHCAIDLYPNTQKTNRPTIGLVLSGGGFRGMSQIGVLKVLERHHIPIDFIVGTSIGSYIGGLYASGYNATEIEQIVLSEDWNMIMSPASENNRHDMFIDQKNADDRHIFSLRLRTFSFDVPQAVSKGIPFQAHLQKYIWNAPYTASNSFDDLKIPFRAISTDLISGKSIIHRSGDLPFIIKASSTIPLRYSPVAYDSMLLVDGGILDNIPVRVLRQEFNPDIIITINATSGLLSKDELQSPWSIAEQVVGILLKDQEQKSLEESPITITPELGEIKNTDPSQITISIIKGEIAALQMLQAINDTIETLQFLHNHTDFIDSNFYTHTLTGDIAKIPSDTWQRMSQVLEARMRVELMHDTLLRILRADSISFVKCKPIIDTLHQKVEWNILAPKHINFSINETRDRKRVLSTLFTDKNYLNTISHNLQWDRIVSGNEYESVDIKTRLQKDTLAFDVFVHEKAPQYLGIGARVDNERYGQLLIDGYDKDIFGSGLWSSLSVFGGSRNRSGMFSIGLNGIFESSWGLTMHAYSNFKQMFMYQHNLAFSKETYEIRRNGELKEDRYGYMADLTRSLGKSGILQSRLRYENQRIFSINNDSTPTYSPIFTWKLSSKIDTRDDADLPRFGSLLDLSLETSISILQDQISFSRITASYAQSLTANHITVTPKFTAVFSDNTTPNPEYISLGRDDLFFGKREDDQRGSQLLLSSCELRWATPVTILVPIHVSARYDIGSTWTSFNGISIANLQHGIGCTLSAKTPIGTARISAGKSFYFVASPDGIVQGPLLFSFSIGSRF
ncbi:MAG: patatin-like phospholipase family protein [Bacteroidota bacterium]